MCTTLLLINKMDNPNFRLNNQFIHRTNSNLCSNIWIQTIFIKTNRFSSNNKWFILHIINNREWINNNNTIQILKTKITFILCKAYTLKIVKNKPSYYKNKIQIIMRCRRNNKINNLFLNEKNYKKLDEI